MHTHDIPQVAGLLLAAGAGSRYGRPKALAADADGTGWLVRAALALESGGCDPVLVVLGAGGDEAESLLRASSGRFARPERVRVVRAAKWADGLSASLAAGLDALLVEDAPATPVDPDAGIAPADPDAAVTAEAAVAPADPVTTVAPVTAVALVPVDVPDLDAAAVARLIDAVTPDTLRQAHFGGSPGHPVVIGRNHWAGLSASLAGDTGARPYLVAHNVVAVPCDDLGTGADVDVPPVASRHDE